MAFPVSPTDGQQSTIANIVYQYSSATNSWTVIPGYANAITATGNITASYFIGNGSQLTGITGGGGSGTPGGANTQIQFNDGGSFGGSAGFTFDKTSNVVSAVGNINAGNLIQAGTRVLKWTTVANTAPSNAVAGDFWYDSYTGIKYQYTNDGTSSFWIDQSFPTTFTTLTTNQILNGGSSGTGNIGAAGGTFNTVFAKATSAQYADVAEKYVADSAYPPGTVLEFGGNQEVTMSSSYHSTSVAGVVSTNPAYIMNADATGDAVVELALLGRVPCNVIGTIKKGDRLVSSQVPGVATALNSKVYQPGCIIGKALENYDSERVGTIEVVVGRV